ncbi:glycosyltransferase [Luteolibacter luteus]|uniref:Glycosyltransferase n=1 Tax=Luteolibacter luteus TaxID=2728835 RepID=A0A858RFQ0_9BACT|nr:glycosyltransferase [Luteolibacter luteus]QJE95378.1 glycosyltransferase [Luteolibacter luteus]
MRIVHAANLQLDKDGAHLWNQDQKIHHGLIRLGHFVYPFSINDRARMLSPTKSKTFGKGRANKALIETCRNVHPDLLILGHAQYITTETLREIRRILPQMRIGLWYVDPLWDAEDTQHLRDRLEVLDALFCSTGGPLLEALAAPNCPTAFIPSAVDAGIECHRAFETPEAEIQHDLLFFGRDKGEPGRRAFLQDLRSQLPDLRVGYYGCLDHPGIFGWEKEQIIRRSKIALNLSRRTDVELYSSSRIAELMGNGILTLTPRGAGLEGLYAEDEIIYFDGAGDLAEKVRYFSSHADERIAIARKGWERNHRDYSGTEIARFIVNLTLRDPAWVTAPWSSHVFEK